MDNYVALLETTCISDLKELLVREARGLGFPLVNAIVVTEKPGREPTFFDVSNAPSEWLAGGGSDPNAYRRDPVMQHCKRSSIPIVWDRCTYLGSGVPDLWDEQAAYGYRTGVCTAFHFPGGRHFVLGIDRDTALPSDPEVLSHLAGSVQLLAVYANEALGKILHDRTKDIEGPTARELEVLSWIALGKTSWEASAILGISERTVSKHLNAAARKLGAVDGQHAAVLAWRSGLIR